MNLSVYKIQKIIAYDFLSDKGFLNFILHGVHVHYNSKILLAPWCV
jgi:hypothetical protein